MTKQILIVEDESSIADNISYALSTEGFDPLRSATGRGALETLSKANISLIILDIGLPDLNGFDLMQEIRKHYDVPVIFLTARSNEVDRVVGLEIGADDYIVKPFSPRELTARVRAVLRRAAAKSTACLPAEPGSSSCYPFELDDRQCTIAYFDKPLELSRYEYRLLRFLVLHPGQVFSREQLMNQIWEEPEMSFDRTVDTHIKTIRQKLRAVRPDKDPITTHRGLGYSLQEIS